MSHPIHASPLLLVEPVDDRAEAVEAMLGAARLELRVERQRDADEARAWLAESTVPAMVAIVGEIGDGRWALVEELGTRDVPVLLSCWEAPAPEDWRERGVRDVVHGYELWRLARTVRRAARSDDAGEVARARYDRALERMVGLSARLGSASDRRELATIVDRACRELLGCGGGALLTVEDGELVIPDAVAAAHHVPTRRPLGSTLVEAALTARAPRVVPDTQAPDGPGFETLPPTIRALCLFPVRTDHPIGALAVFWPRPHAPTHEELAIAGSMASLVAAAADALMLRADLEAHVARRTAQLDEANHALEAFNSAVAHDLRSPAISVAGFSEIALEDPTLSDDARRMFERVHRAGVLMTDRIDALHAITRAVPLELEQTECDLSALARDIAAELREAEPDRDVVVDVQDGLSAHLDPRMARTALENLLRNAFKFTRERPDARIEVGRNERIGAFFVRDNGVGFDPRRSRELFRPFRRLHAASRFEGTGIGLSIVHRVIGRHGGRVWAESIPDHGACFYFTLPE
ncbi:MAG: GAF domain-containing protein [Myxococcales bacterium]|nr:GAF domain-containing protein [Myxococcales bacterium]